MQPHPRRRFPVTSLAIVALLLFSVVPMPVGAAPSITGVNPSTATTNGGIVATITGSGFEESSSFVVKSVTLGGTEATILAAGRSDTSFQILVPSRSSAGTVNVVVTNQDGTTAQFTNGFRYDNGGAPTISSISPNSENTNGDRADDADETTRVTGTNFFVPASDATGAVDVGIRIGGFLPSSIVPSGCSFIGSEPGQRASLCTTLTFKAPPHSVGAKDVVVVNPDGKSATRASGFTYTEATAPVVSGVSPISGSANGGTALDITGTGFAAGAIVRVGGSIADDVSVNEPGTLITATAPPHASGSVDVTVTNPNGHVATRSAAFTYNPEPDPTLNGSPVTPDEGATTGGSRVTITGSGFHPQAQFTFDGVPAQVIGTPTSGSATVITPAHAAGDVAVRVTNPDGKSATRSPTSSNNIFTYNEAVRIISIPTNEGSRNGGSVITITGQGFSSDATVYFVHGSDPTEVEALGTTLSGQSLSVTVPPSVATSFGENCYLATSASNCHRVDVRVENPSGAEAWLLDGFAYKDAAPPAFAATNVLCTTASGSCTAPSTSENGGQTLFIRGTNFHTNPKPTVMFGPCSSEACPEEATVGQVQSTSIQVTVPPREAGAGGVDLVVKNPGGQEITRTFTYTDAPNPTFSASSIPAGSGSTNGGNTITISGSNFHTDPKPTVTFGGTDGTVGTVQSSSIQVTVPPLQGGGLTVTVQVKNPGGGEAAPPTQYTYNTATAPTVDSVSQSSASILGGASVTITGTNFHTSPKPTVTFNGIEAAVGTVQSTSIRVTVPAATSIDSDVDIVVTNPDGQDDELTSAFAYTSPSGSPQVTSVSPSTGRAGAEVTITGSNFAIPGPDEDPDDPDFPPRPAVTIGTVTVPKADVTPVSSSSIKFLVPEVLDSGDYSITVENPDGLSGTIGNAFNVPAGADDPSFMSGPAVSVVCSLDDGAGAATTNGGEATVTGDFDDGAAVLFGGVPGRITAVTVGVDITTRIPAFTSPGSPTATVVNPDGQSVGIFRACTISPAPAPLIDTWLPTAGPASGGMLLTIIGENFADGMTARFGGFAATHIEFDSDTGILSVRAPAHTSGTTDLTITNPDGKSASIEDAFGFVGEGGPAAATVTSVSPNTGPSLGGTSVTITGTAFATGATVTFGGTAATSVVVGSTTTITAVTPAHAVGAVDVAVTNPGASAGTLDDGFTYTASAPPTVSSVSPDEGSTNGGTTVTVTGTNFANGATVSFGATEAASVTFVSSTSLTAVTPARTNAGAVDVTVTNPDDQEDTLDDGFTYESAPPPEVTSFSPTQGPSVGGTSVTISGTGFANGATVSFGGRDSPTVAVASNGNSLTATTPGHPAGSVNVVVTNPDGQSDTEADAFTYTASPAPTISSVTPTSGPTAGGTAITIAGTNFAAGARVLVDGEDATSVVVTSSSQITARTPAGDAGSQDVVVVNPDDQEATLAGGFTYGGGITRAQIAAANEALQDSVRVSRSGGDNVITWNMPSGLAAEPQGVQIWRATSPFLFLASIEEDDAAFAAESYRDPASRSARYVVTVFFGDSEALGKFSGDLDQVPGYTGVTDAGFEQIGVSAAGDGDIAGLPIWGWVLIVGGLVVLIVLIVLLVGRNRREDTEEWDDSEQWDQPAPRETSQAWTPGHEDRAPAGGWTAEREDAPEETFHLTCPECRHDFEAVGTRPLNTRCPQCGVEGLVR